MLTGLTAGNSAPAPIERWGRRMEKAGLEPSDEERIFLFGLAATD
jgi:hypothetical protein